MNRKLFFVSDGHLNAFMYTNNPLIKGDTYRAFASIVDVIISDPTENKAVIFSGDMLDTKKPTSQDIHEFQTGVMKLRSSDISVYGIDGNHDLCKPSWSVTCGVHLINNKVMDVLGYSIGGFSYVAGVGIHKRMAEWSDIECDFLIIHQPFNNLSPFEVNTLDMEDIPDSVGIAVVSGHVHTNYTGKNSRGTYLISPGAIHARKINHDSGTFVSYSDKEGIITIDVPYARDIYRERVTNNEDLLKIEKDLEDFPKITNNDLKPILGIKYSLNLNKGTLVNISRFLENKEYKDKVFFISTVVGSLTKDDLVSASTQGGLSAEALLTKVMEDVDWEDRNDIYDCLLPFIKDGDMDMLLNKCAKFKEERDAVK